MSALNQNAPRMRRHKRRINDDGSELAHAVRSFIDQQSDESAPLLARQADGANGIGPGGNRGNSGAPAMGGGFGNTGTGSDGSNGAGNANSNSATATSTRASSGNGNSNSGNNGNDDENTGNVRPTATATSTTPLRNLHPTTTATSSSPGILDGILGGLGFTSSSSTSSTPTSTSTSSSATSTSSSTTSSSSTRSSSSSSSSSTVSVPTSTLSSDESQTTASSDHNHNTSDDSSTRTRNDGSDTISSSRSSIVPITATAVVTATPTASLAAAASASSTPKSTSSSAGPIIGIVAGALVGVVVLSGLIGFLFKKYKKQDDPYEGNPFDRDAFQRHSAMIPDHYESDEGHGGAGGMTPEMSEHYQQYNNFSPHYESGMSAGAAGAVGAMGAMAAHNETGGPRPPTMFAKHAAGVQQNQPQVGAYYKDGDFSNQMNTMPPHSDYHAPPVAAFANHHSDQQYLDEPGFGQGGHRAISPAPQLPPLAAFGGDPYSIAGVGRGQQQQQPHNVANPYAHLDRSHGAGSFVPGSIVSPGAGGHTAGSASVSSGADSADQRHASINAAEALAAGLAHQSSLNRSTHDTAGRPGTAEGRSGTPDLPNVQQTYAVEQDALRNPFDQPAQQPKQYSESHLQVRNLMPGGASAGQRLSTASSMVDDEDAYGGVY